MWLLLMVILVLGIKWFCIINIECFYKGYIFMEKVFVYSYGVYLVLRFVIMLYFKISENESMFIIFNVKWKYRLFGNY